MTQDISLEKLLSKISSAPSEDCSIEGTTIKIKRILGSFYEVLFRQYTLLTHETGYCIEITNCEFTSSSAPTSVLRFIGTHCSRSDHEEMRRVYHLLRARTEEAHKEAYEAFLRRKQESIDHIKDLLDQ